MGSFSIAHILVLIAIFFAPLAAILIFRSAANRSSAKFHSLKVTSPILIALVLIYSFLKPLLQTPELAQRFLPTSLANASLLIMYLTLAATVVLSALFYYKSLANLNFFSNRIVLSPIWALLTIIPLINLLGIPLIQYFAYYGSMGLFPKLRVSKFLAFITTFGAMALFIAGITAHVIASRNATVSIGPAYDVAFWIASSGFGLAAGILFARIIRRVNLTQEAYAASSQIPPPQISRTTDLLQTIAIALLALVAIAALAAPEFAASLVERFLPAAINRFGSPQ